MYLVALVCTMTALQHRLRIVAAGRGRTMCLPPVVQAVKDLLPTSNNILEQPTLVYLGTATYDKDEPFSVQTHAYDSWCRVIKLNVSEPTEPDLEHVRQTIASSHAILVSGGNTKYAIERWKALGIDRMIQDRVQQDPPPVLCGGSAGAICWFEDGHSDSLDPTTFRIVDPDLTEDQKKDWKYIRCVRWKIFVEGFLYHVACSHI